VCWSCMVPCGARAIVTGDEVEVFNGRWNLLLKRCKWACGRWRSSGAAWTGKAVAVGDVEPLTSETLTDLAVGLRSTRPWLR